MLVLDFLCSRKAKTSCSLDSTVISFHHSLFFKDASGSIPGASRKAAFGSFDGHLRFDS